MGGSCAKKQSMDKSGSSVFIRTIPKHILKPSPSQRSILENETFENQSINPYPTFQSNEKLTFKSSSYNLLDLSFSAQSSHKSKILSSKEEDLTKKIRIKKTKPPRINQPIKNYRRESDISVLQLPDEKRTKTPPPNIMESSKPFRVPISNAKKMVKKPFSSSPISDNRDPPSNSKIFRKPRFKPIRKPHVKKKLYRDKTPSFKPKNYSPKMLIANKQTITNAFPTKKKIEVKKPTKKADPFINKSSAFQAKKKFSSMNKETRAKKTSVMDIPKINTESEFEPKPSISENVKNSNKKEPIISKRIRRDINAKSIQRTKKANNAEDAEQRDPLKKKVGSLKRSVLQRKEAEPEEILFTNLSYVKSATHSMESNVSNFERRTKIERFPDKKITLNEAGLGKVVKLKNNFAGKNFVEDEKKAFSTAIKNLQSGDWEKEIMGLEAIVSLTRTHPEMVKTDLKLVVRLLSEAVKNLRSQVCRSGAQAFAELFIIIGKQMESESEKVINLLLSKSADTNRFIRQDCEMALDVAMENLNVYRSLNTILNTGVPHKNVMVRTNTARIFSNVIRAIGVEKVMGSSKEFQSLVFTKGCELLADGSLEVRTHAKEAFRGLATHERFDKLIEDLIPESQRRYIQKSLDSIKIKI